MNLRFEDARLCNPDFYELKVSRGRGDKELFFMYPFKATTSLLQTLSLMAESEKKGIEMDYSGSTEEDAILDEIAFELAREIETLTDEKVRHVNESIREFFDGEDEYRVRLQPIGLEATGENERIEGYFRATMR